eukprot:14713830-Alexandrium_andersonii.AAC.1
MPAGFQRRPHGAGRGPAMRCDRGWQLEPRRRGLSPSRRAAPCCYTRRGAPAERRPPATAGGNRASTGTRGDAKARLARWARPRRRESTIERNEARRR